MLSNQKCQEAPDAFNDFGYVMVRPDGLELSIDEDVVNRIEQVGFEVVKRRIHRITGEEVDGIYPDLHDKHFYRFMREALAGQRVVSMLVAGPSDVSSTLMNIKGSALHVRGTVRGDYSLGHRILPPELYAQYVTGTLTDASLNDTPWQVMLRDDRMHCDENAACAANSIGVVFDSHDMQDVAYRRPRLYEAIRAAQHNGIDKVRGSK